ncbi:AraC family transcriptional regulator [Pseudomonas violetae]|uniref:Helix-turn-helix transcriptional regulator n=1 Tax=Pseudomonas violetae TaxID=2915813 RepID=A0ABT0ETA0_9PSED|nr:helix-turn-helix transcriptional regulator [Pseudomonas violetae]MCK1788849.1 helix-turn-helix transcriptional regulator [Pseudomonas violetae]
MDISISEIARQHPDQSIYTLALDLSGGKGISIHQHTEGQLLFAPTGVLAVTTNAGCWVVPSGQGLWIPANEPHWTRTIGTSRISVVYLSDERSAGLPVACTLLGISTLLQALISAVLRVTMDGAQKSRDYHLMALLVEELEAAPTSSKLLPIPGSNRLKDLCRAISANATLDWGLAECAQFLGINMKTVQRWFQTDMGISFGEWRKQVRLFVALENLALGKSVLEVSLDAGYLSPSAFSAMFRREFGISPSAFQKI